MAWQLILVMIMFVVFYIAYFLFVFYFLFNNSKKKKTYEKFYNILNTIYLAKMDIDQSVEVLKINYNQLTIDISCLCNYKLIELLNYCIYCIDSKTFYKLKIPKKTTIDEINELRKFILEILNRINKEDPFSLLSSKEASILKNISLAFDTNNSKIGKNNLKELASELLLKENLIAKEQRKTRFATILTIIGILLTIIFGIVSLIK